MPFLLASASCVGSGFERGPSDFDEGQESIARSIDGKYFLSNESSEFTRDLWQEDVIVGADGYCLPDPDPDPNWFIIYPRPELVDRNMKVIDKYIRREYNLNQFDLDNIRNEFYFEAQIKADISNESGTLPTNLFLLEIDNRAVNISEFKPTGRVCRVRK